MVEFVLSNALQQENGQDWQRKQSRKTWEKELGSAYYSVSKAHGMEGKDSQTIARICTIERLNWDQSWSGELGWCTLEGQCWGIYATKTRLQIAQKSQLTVALGIHKERQANALNAWRLLFKDYEHLFERGNMTVQVRSMWLGTQTREVTVSDWQEREKPKCGKLNSEAWDEWEDQAERGSHQTLWVPPMGGTIH